MRIQCYDFEKERELVKPDFYSHLSPIADSIFVREKNILEEKLISTFLEFQRKTVASEN